MSTRFAEGFRLQAAVVALFVQIPLLIVWGMTGGIKGPWTALSALAGFLMAPGMLAAVLLDSAWRAAPGWIELLVFFGTQVGVYWVLIIVLYELQRGYREGKRLNQL